MLKFSQTKYAKKVLSMFHMNNTNPVNIPRECHYSCTGPILAM